MINPQINRCNALIMNELRYLIKKVAFPVHYLRDFG